MYKIIIGEALSALQRLESNSVNCCITSPPYYGLRDYGADGQIGLEDTPSEYIEKLVAVFREVRHVLKMEGTLWLNMGDSYAGSGNGLNFEGERNYIVTTMETYKQIIHDIPWRIGVIVACPWNRKPTDEFENPTPLDDKSVEEWETKVIRHAHPKDRKRSMSQMLFYMLRSGK